jgi:hypothetical protein
MDEIKERRLRRQGIRRLLKGQLPTRIARWLHRSRPWLNKWWHRFLDERWPGLKRRSRQPQHSKHGYSPRTRRLIVRARRILERAPAGSIGPNAVRQFRWRCCWTDTWHLPLRPWAPRRPTTRLA